MYLLEASSTEGVSRRLNVFWLLTYVVGGLAILYFGLVGPSYDTYAGIHAWLWVGLSWFAVGVLWALLRRLLEAGTDGE